MEISVQRHKHSLVELTITLTDAEHKKYREAAIRSASESMKFDGFRAGHAPLDLVEKRLGEASCRSVFFDYALSKAYAEAITRESLPVIARPEVVILSENPLAFTATVAVLPTVELGETKNIQIKQKTVEVSEKEIDEVVEQLRERTANFSVVDRKAKKNDRIEIDFDGFDLDGNAIPNTASKNHPLVLGSNQFIPGFEDELMGAKAGETIEFNISFPKEYHSATMAGKKVKFRVLVHSVAEKSLPVVDESFVKLITGSNGTVASMRDEIKTHLLEKKSAEEEQRREAEAIEALRKMAKMELPQVLIDSEVEYLLDEVKFSALQQGLPWEKYLEVAKKSEVEIQKGLVEGAISRVEARLALQALVAREHLAVADEVVDAEAAHTAQHEASHHHHHDGEACHNPAHAAEIEKRFARGASGWISIKSRLEIGRAIAFLLAQ